MLLLQQMLIYQLILVLPERYSLRGNILRLRGITQITREPLSQDIGEGEEGRQEHQSGQEVAAEADDG